MNFKEAELKSLKVKWKSFKCGQKDCWCLGVEPVEKIVDDKGNEIIIAPSGVLSDVHANYIIKLHNKSLLP